MLKADISIILDNLLMQSKSFYGNWLVTLGVYGSVGRGAATQFSDLDILLVVKNLQQGRLSRIREFDKLEALVTDVLTNGEKVGYQVDLQPVIKTPEEVQQGSLLFLDMLEDLKILYDRDSFFETFLSGFKSRLNGLNARKIKKGSMWYWDLKPDYKAGEIIHLYKLFTGTELLH